MDKPKVTPKDFFLWAGAMIALYSSVFAFIALFFDYINYAFPDPLLYVSSDPYSGGVSYEMATLIVMFPIYLLIMWAIRRDIRMDKTRSEIWVRRWALVLTLFIAALTVAIDLITLIMYFFNGELTMHFILKVLVVLLVASVAVMHFLADMWGYWDQYPQRQRSVMYGAIVLLILSIGAGFLIIGTPMQARLYRFDEQTVVDLQTIQSQIVYYYQQKQHLPVTLNDVNDPVSNYTVPTDPQTGMDYQYQQLQASSTEPTFKLCANFNKEEHGNSQYSVPQIPGSKDNWYHTAGNQCFTRSIDPQLYPPMKGVN